MSSHFLSEQCSKFSSPKCYWLLNSVMSFQSLSWLLFLQRLMAPLPFVFKVLLHRLSLYFFPHSSVGKESICNAGDLGSIPGLGRSPGEGNGNPLQYSCLENPMDKGAWQVTVHGVARVGHNLMAKPHFFPHSPLILVISSYLGSLSDSLCFSSPALRYYFSKESSSVIFVFCYNEDHYKYYSSIPDPSFLMSQLRIFSGFQNIVSSFLQNNLFSYKWCFFSTAFPGHPWTIGSEAPMDTKIHRCSSLFCKIK